MNIDDKTYELIERFLGGLMSEEQEANFQQQMKDNPALADQVKIFKIMPDYLEDKSFPTTEYESDNPKAQAYLDELLKEETRDLKNHLQSKGEEFESSSTENSNMGVWRVLRIAAILLVLVAAATFLFRPSETQRLYSNNVDHQELILNVRGAPDQMEQEAESLFNAKKYAEALPLLQQLETNQEEDNFDLKLALGIAQLETGHEDEAMNTFESIYHSDALIRQDALFYMAMTYLKSGNKPATVEMLTQLRTEFPSYKPNAIDDLISRL